jgi:Fe-S oxidoreductase/coenzyme F420-reducing hydrogenase delta subunit
MTTTATTAAKAGAFEPEIVALCCNWCGYAGADLAGVSRVQYPPNIRIIRIMCTGRVEPNHVLKALQLGADGVMIIGCHPGDCHYSSGNTRAVDVIEATREMLRPLGMDGRLRLEWISAAEGSKFGKVVAEFTEQVKALGPNPMKGTPASRQGGHKARAATREQLDAIIDRTGVYNCVECTKCSSSCPIARIDMRYSPMLTAERALRGLAEELSTDKGVWVCTTCATCHQRCPAGVDYLGFVRQVRELGQPASSTCSHGGVFTSLSRLQSNPAVRQSGRLAWVSEGMKVQGKGETLFFTGCSTYQEPVFRNIDAHPLDTTKATVRVLNKAGIAPVVMEDERCCGHDLLWAGEDVEVVAKLARINVDAIRATGAKRVVFSCPEGYRTFAKDYPELLGEKRLDFDVMHSSELFAKLIDDGKLVPDGHGEGGEKAVVTYQDPCRLGRHMGVYDAPRKVIAAMPGVELREMPNNRANAICCGVASWLNCGTYSKRIQVERLAEAAGTGAGTLVTACSKCLIHYSCVLNEPANPLLPEKPKVAVRDLTVMLAESLGIKEVGK